MNVVGGSSTISANGVGLTQGSGDVTISGATLTAVLLGKGLVTDSADAFANTYIVGDGNLDVHGIAVVAAVQLGGNVALDRASAACIAIGNEGMTLTNAAPSAAANVTVSASGLRSLDGANIGPLQAWATYDPVPK